MSIIEIFLKTNFDVFALILDKFHDGRFTQFLDKFHGGRFTLKGLVKKYRGGRVGRSREGVGHEVLSLVLGVGRAIFSYS